LAHALVLEHGRELHGGVDERFDGILRAFARFGTTTDERGGGQSTRRSRRGGRRTRIGKVWTRSASRTKVPDRAGDDVDSSASALETLGTRDTTRPTSCLVARKSHRGTSSERVRANRLDAPCGYPTMSEQSRIARSLEPRIARKAASAHPRSSPSRTLSCDVMSVVVIRTPARAGRCAWVQRRPLSGALLFSEERRAPLDGRSLLCVTLPRV
jgi:hypothetical protein